MSGNRWAVLAVASLAYFMTQLDAIVLTLALPDIRRDLPASLDQAVWALSAYLLALAGLLVTAGRLGDLYGRRRVLLVGVALFTLFGTAGGFAQDPAQLIGARALQGVGAALLIPQTMALLVEAFPPERRGTALGVRAAAGGSAVVAGPVLGGLLVTAVDWRWVLLVNAPVGAALLVAAWLAVPRTRSRAAHPLDLAGVALASTGLLCFTLAVTQRSWPALALSALLVGGFVVQQRRRQDREPLVPFELFRDRGYPAMNAFAVATAFTVIGLVLVLSVHLQSALGFSALKAGLVLLPASAVSVALGPVAGRLANAVEPRIPLLGGVAATVAGILWLAVVTRGAAEWTAFVAPMCVVGAGNALLFTPLAVVALRRVEPRVAGAAAGILATFLQIGSTLGAASVGALVETAPTRTALLVLAAVTALSTVACLASA